MKIIRASEIGTYQYCHRAWWYQLQGYESDKKLEMDQGRLLHTRHAYTVTAAGCLQVAAYGLVLVAILSSLIWLIQLKL